MIVWVFDDTVNKLYTYQLIDVTDHTQLIKVLGYPDSRMSLSLNASVIVERTSLKHLQTCSIPRKHLLDDDSRFVNVLRMLVSLYSCAQCTYIYILELTVSFAPFLQVH